MNKLACSKTKFGIALLMLLSMCGTGWAKATEKPAVSERLASLASKFVPTEQEKKDGAVVLYREINDTIDSDGKSVTDTYFAIAILDEDAANDYGYISTEINKYFENVELVYARTLLPDGSVAIPERDAIKYASIDDTYNKAFNNFWRLSFSLPKLMPGSFIEYKFRYKFVRPVIDGGWWDKRQVYDIQASSFQKGGIRLDGVRKYKLSVKVSDKLKLRYKMRNYDGFIHNETKSGNYVQHDWILNDMPSRKVERQAPGLYNWIPYISLTTLDDWDEVNDWSRQYYLAEASDEIRKLALDVTSGAKTKRDKIEKIYYYLQDKIRYISANFNRNGVVAHKPEEVLKNKYGDCKDISNLYATMLRSVGITAYPALVNPLYNEDEQLVLPSLNFEHMIVYIPEFDGPNWIDLTGDRNTFPGLDPVFSGRQAFVLNGRSNGVVRTAISTSTDNHIDIKIIYDLSKDPVTASVSIVAKGGVGNRLKYVFHRKDNKESLERLLDGLHKGARTSSVALVNDSAMLPFKVEGTIKFKDAWKEDGKKLVLFGGLNQILTFTEFGGLRKSDFRTLPYVINKGLKINLTTTIESPGKDYYMESFATGAAHKSKYFTVTMSSKDTNGVNSKSISLKIEPQKIDKKDYNAFVADVEDAQKESVWILGFMQDPQKAKEQNLSNKLKDNGKVSLAEQKELVRIYIGKAKYREAKKLSQKLVKDNPNDGEANYLLALSLGYIGEYGASDKYFAKAEKLKYKE